MFRLRLSLTLDPVLTYGFLTVYALSVGTIFGDHRIGHNRPFQAALFLTAILFYYAALTI